MLSSSSLGQFHFFQRHLTTFTFMPSPHSYKSVTCECSHHPVENRSKGENTSAQKDACKFSIVFFAINVLQRQKYTWKAIIVIHHNIKPIQISDSEHLPNSTACMTHLIHHKSNMSEQCTWKSLLL